MNAVDVDEKRAAWNERLGSFMQLYGTLVYPGHPPELQREMLEAIQQGEEVKRQAFLNAKMALEEAFKNYKKDE